MAPLRQRRPMLRQLPLTLTLTLTLTLISTSRDVACLAMEAGKDNACRQYPVQIGMCLLSGTNTTSLKNQEDAKKVLQGLKQLADSSCAPFVKQFICTMHLPLCQSQLEVKPCYEFCCQVRSRCKIVLQKVGHTWPESLQCEGLKRHADKDLCIIMDPETWNKEERILRDRNHRWMVPIDGDKSDRQPKTKDVTPNPNRACSKAEVTLTVDSVCAPKCHANLMFTREDKEFASAWMLVWSVICLASTVLAVATFAMDSERFRFPERPMVWVAVCYLLYSSGHILRICLGPEVACSGFEDPKGQELYRVSRHAGHWCAVVFLILYFSSLAGCLWWVLLTVCWYLCAAKKWAHEVLSDKSVWLHVCAWGLPLLMTVVLLVLHRIEGDELTHLCLIDGSNKSNILIFAIAPVALCLAVGLCFLLFSLCSTMSMRHNLKWSGNANFRRLEKLMSKISLFSLLFVLPTASVLAINIYEYAWRDTWRESLEATLALPRCSNASGLLLSEDKCLPQHRPTSAFFMLKIFMSLAVGLPSGLIVWFNCKSLNAWTSCCSRILLRRKRKQQHQQQHQHRHQYQHHLGYMPSAAAVGQGAMMQKQAPNQHLLGSSHNKYPPINGIGTSAV